jgi:hypothetical protein
VIAAGDVVIVNIASGATTSSYGVGVQAVAAGSCSIHLRNVTAATSLSEALVLNFASSRRTNERAGSDPRPPLWGCDEQPSDWQLIDDGSFNGLRKYIRSSDEDQGTVQVRYEQDTTRCSKPTSGRRPQAPEPAWATGLRRSRASRPT